MLKFNPLHDLLPLTFLDLISVDLSICNLVLRRDHCLVLLAEKQTVVSGLQFGLGDIRGKLLVLGLARELELLVSQHLLVLLLHFEKCGIALFLEILHENRSVLPNLTVKSLLLPF